MTMWLNGAILLGPERLQGEPGKHEAAVDMNDIEGVLSGVGWMPVSGRTQLGLSGADRAKFLHNYCTADVKGLAVGSGVESFLTSVQGKTLSHGFIWSDDGELEWESEPGQAERLLAHLDRYLLRDEVRLADLGPARWQLWLLGPRAAEAMGRIGLAVPAERLRQAVTDVEGSRTWVRRYPDLIVPWLAVVGTGDRERAELIRRLSEAGVPEVDPSTWEILRVEAGWARYGIDLGPDNLPQELGRNAQAICFTKGCYLGQETVARIDALGHVNRYLVGLWFPGAVDDGLPVAGQELTVDGRVVGQVTSVVSSPRLAARVGMGYIRRELARPGTVVESSAGSVRVVEFPMTVEGVR